MQRTTKRCRYCGSDIDIKAVLCVKCGRILDKSVSITQPARSNVQPVQSVNTVVAQQSPRPKTSIFSNTLCCPNRNCRSTNIVPVNTKEKFSLGKAVVGGAVGTLINPIGALVGASTGLKGKTGKTSFYCQDCGTVFKKKI